jgi:hypothetical protein
MNRFRTVFVYLIAFAILAAVTIGAALLFFKEPQRTIAFYVVVGQIVAGEAILFLLLARSIISTGRKGGASGVTQLGTYRTFLLAYFVSLAITVAYFGFNVQRQGEVNDYIFAGIQLLVLGIPLFYAIMSESTQRFVQADGLAAQEEGDRAQRRARRAFRGIEEAIDTLPAEARTGAAMQQLDLAMRTLRSSIDAKLGLRNADSRDLVDDIEDLEARFKAGVRNGGAPDTVIADLAAQVTRAAQRL